MQIDKYVLSAPGLGEQLRAESNISFSLDKSVER